MKEPLEWVSFSFERPARTTYYRASDGPRNTRFSACLHLWGDGVVLASEYLDEDYRYDGQKAGVLADWVEENTEECMARNPLVTRDMLESWCDYLRVAFNSPERNKTPGPV